MSGASSVVTTERWASVHASKFGSTGREYAAAVKEGEEVLLPGRIQADVYAQALRARLEGLHGAGALYLSYSAKSRGTAFVGCSRRMREAMPWMVDTQAPSTFKASS